MATEIVTRDDLQKLKEDIFTGLAKLIKEARLGKPEYLSQDDVLKMLDISSNTLRNFRDNYGLPCHRLGNRVYYAYSDVVKMMENNKNYF